MKQIVFIIFVAAGCSCFVGMTGFGRGLPDATPGTRGNKVVLIGETMSARVRENPRTAAEAAALEWGSPLSCLQVMDDEGVALGQTLSGLRGEEFQRVYREHIQHILTAQERARQAPAGANR